MYTVGSLFTGIGGFDLAFQSAGFSIAFQVEIDDYCQRVLLRHWPDVPKFSDVCEVGSHNLPYADVLCGGFPCQDISLAGKRAGIRDGTRSGLWFQLARVIGELRPRVVLLENVAAITTAGGGGSIVLADLAEMGYDARWGVIRASDAGAPHQRARWFCMANPASLRQHGNSEGCGGVSACQTEGRQSELARGSASELADTSQFIGFDQLGKSRKLLGTGSQGQKRAANFAARSRGNANGKIIPGLGRNANGLSYRLDDPQWPAGPGQSQHDWEPPRTTQQRGHRAARLKALGNAVVPQVVYPLAVIVREWLDQNK